MGFKVRQGEVQTEILPHTSWRIFWVLLSLLFWMKPWETIIPRPRAAVRRVRQPVQRAPSRGPALGGGVHLACASGVSTQEVTRNQDSSCLNLGSQLEKLGSLNKDTDALGPPPQISWNRISGCGAQIPVWPWTNKAIQELEIFTPGKLN